MEGIEHLGRKELREIVVKQQTDLARYKTRLKDLVSAHKVLLNEKELLEQSLKSLTASNVSCCGSETSKESCDDRQSEDLIKISSDSSDSESTEHLKNQLSTLMNSLAQLSEVKSRMEASFQADKKQLRSEKTVLENKINELEGRLEHETKAHLSEMEVFKSKLLSERHQREKEHNDHGVMIRELQKLVAEERSKREMAEANISTLKSELNSAREALDQSRTELAESNAKAKELTEKMKDYKENSGAIAIKLQEELTQLKMQHMKVTLEEQERMKEAEEKSKRLASAHEERVAKLEERLAELSLTVGLYDRLRQGDQIAIEKLKDRLVQLERELGEEKSDLAVDDIVNRLKQLKKLMDSAGSTASEKPLEVKKILNDIFDSENAATSDVHKQCQEEYDQLKNEFDKYKHQFYVVQQNVTPSYRVSQSKEAELNVQIKKLREIISNLHSQMQENNVLHKQELDRQKQLLGTEKIKFQEKLISVEAASKNEILQLEAQLAKQRERALKLVEEKDEEIAELKKSLNLLPRISTDKSGENDGVVLHYSEEMARRDVELTRLRKDKLIVEAALRDALRDVSQLMAHEKHLSSLLQHQIERFEHCQSREGANLEYLKNVVFSFLLSTDANSKSHMLNAITAVLKFTDDEKAKIAQSSWWFTHP